MNSIIFKAKSGKTKGLFAGCLLLMASALAYGQDYQIVRIETQGHEEYDVAVDAAGNLYVADPGGLFKYPRNTSGYDPGHLVAEFDKPIHMALDRDANIYVVEKGVSQIIKYARKKRGYRRVDIPLSLTDPHNVAVDAHGYLYLIDGKSNISKSTKNGPVDYGDFEPIICGVKRAFGLAVDAAGNLYVTSWGANDNPMPAYRTRKYVWNGSGYDAPDPDTTAALSAGLNWPVDVAVGQSGDVYVSNYRNKEVLRFAWNGAGYDAPAPVVTGMNPNTANLGIALDQAGNVYVAASKGVFKAVPRVPPGSAGI